MCLVHIVFVGEEHHTMGIWWPFKLYSKHIDARHLESLHHSEVEREKTNT